MLEVDLTEHIQLLIDALQPHAAELGLQGHTTGHTLNGWLSLTGVEASPSVHADFSGEGCTQIHGPPVEIKIRFVFCSMLTYTLLICPSGGNTRLYCASSSFGYCMIELSNSMKTTGLHTQMVQSP